MTFAFKPRTLRQWQHEVTSVLAGGDMRLSLGTPPAGNSPFPGCLGWVQTPGGPIALAGGIPPSGEPAAMLALGAAAPLGPAERPTSGSGHLLPL